MDILKVVVFRAGYEEYGLPIEHVISIEKPEHIHFIPNMPSYMTGVVKFRGEFIPVLDITRIFYQEDTAIDEQVKLLVVQAKEMSAAFIVKEAREIINILENALKQISKGAFVLTKYFTSVASFDDRLILMIDSDLFLSSLEGIAPVKEGLLTGLSQKV
ncbi:chemotaxis protein CheW [Bacillus sp. SA1-12]|uniref:chemotaxis protein CheW n=1 Tax=Bacillus sp. SA1-12 TaxID=1455638 RepID=UPI000697D90F|nr:chemotaxis protein CheW [Bacillus sp. SA1-12]